jgi:hypothetical protein
MISIKETTYGNYGKCLAISNDKMEIYVTIDLGPRIIKCNLKGKNNLMFEDIGREKTSDVSSVFGEGKLWNIYGGHRMWLSPEKFPETYYPDCDKVLYSVSGNGVTFTPPVQAVTGLQFSMNIVMDETEAKFTATHSVKNMNEEPIKGAMWCLSVMGQDGAVIVPQPTENTGLLANRILAVWPYTDMTDERIFWGKRYIALRQKPEIADSIKYGINNTAGKIAYINHGQALVKSYTPNHPNGEYPDFGVSCEVYACDLFTEAETLSELQTIKKGESIVHTEVWTLTDGIEIGEFTNESLEKLAEKIF